MREKFPYTITYLSQIGGFHLSSFSRQTWCKEKCTKQAILTRKRTIKDSCSANNGWEFNLHLPSVLTIAKDFLRLEWETIHCQIGPFSCRDEGKRVYPSTLFGSYFLTVSSIFCVFVISTLIMEVLKYEPIKFHQFCRVHVQEESLLLSLRRINHFTNFGKLTFSLFIIENTIAFFICF